MARSAYHMLASEYREAVDLAREALPIAEKLGLGPQRARLLDVIGVSRVLEGDAGGLSDSERAIEAAREAGDLFEFMEATNNLYNGQVFLGGIEAAAAERQVTLPPCIRDIPGLGMQGPPAFLAGWVLREFHDLA